MQSDQKTQTKANIHLVLEKNPFREVMFEAGELLREAMLPKNNLMHAQSLELYDFWAPYMMFVPKHIYESPGYKIAFTQVMSIIMALREKEPKKYMPNVDFSMYEEKDTNVVSFSNFKANKGPSLMSELVKL